MNAGHAMCLDPATDRDIDELMTWFPGATDVQVWGGPKFRYPYTAETFRCDCHWPDMASYSLRDGDGHMLAFGQFYDRNGRINLARLVVHPQHRGRGIGRLLLNELMRAGSNALGLDEFSLFVFRDNRPALQCYLSAGFEMAPYPDDEVLADECYYLTRPVKDRQGQG